MTGCIELVALGIFDSITITNPAGVQQHELSQRAYPIISPRRQGPNSDKTLSAGPIARRICTRPHRVACPKEIYEGTFGTNRSNLGPTRSLFQSKIVRIALDQ